MRKIATFCFVVLCCPSWGFSFRYQVQALESLSDYGRDVPRHIRDDGIVVGTATVDAWGARAVRWENGVVKDVYGSTSTYDKAVYTGISGGNIVSGYQQRNIGDFGFIRNLTNGQTTTVSITYPTMINNSGSIVGDYYLGSSRWQGRYRDASGTTHTLSGLSGATSTQVHDINDSNTIIGTSRIDGKSRAWKASGTDTPQELLGLNDEGTQAWAVNSHGDVVGYYGLDTRGILWKANGERISFGTHTALENGDYAQYFSRDINDSNVVIGTSFMRIGGQYREDPWVWTEESGVHLLTDLLIDGGWQLKTVTGINNLGQIIGSASHTDFGAKEFAVVLNPEAVPEPGTLGVVGAGMLVALRRRRIKRSSA